VIQHVFRVVQDGSASPDFCVFCRVHVSGGIRVLACCTYGWRHEFPSGKPYPVIQTAKRDSKLCRTCGLHPQNPAAKTNGCEHEFAA
jgi:hypothetical protein